VRRSAGEPGTGPNQPMLQEAYGWLQQQYERKPARFRKLLDQKPRVRDRNPCNA
jgi:hypothetical protein